MGSGTRVASRANLDIPLVLRAMEARGLSQRDLASQARIHEGTLSKILAGKQHPSLETALALSAALDLPLPALLRSAGWSMMDFSRPEKVRRLFEPLETPGCV